MLILACIPAHNEESTIGRVIDGCLDHVDQVIVCDDGSTDNTYENALKHNATVLRNSSRKGKGAALSILFEKAKSLNADCVVTIDGDGQFLPEEIPMMLDKRHDGHYDIVVGYRFDSETDMPAHRKLGNKFFDKMTNMISHDSSYIRDTQSGFRVYSSKAIESISFSNTGFGAESEILLHAQKIGLSIGEEKVTVLYNTGGKTSTKHPLVHSGDVMNSLIKYVAIEHPVKFFGLPGIVLFFVGVVFSVVVITIFNDSGYFSIPSTLMALGSLTIGLLLILITVLLYVVNSVTRRHAS